MCFLPSWTGLRLLTLYNTDLDLRIARYGHLVGWLRFLEDERQMKRLAANCG